MSMKFHIPRWREMDKSRVPLDQLIEDFLLAKRSAGCSEKTVSWYGDNLRRFLRFLAEEGQAPVLKSFSAPAARRFTVYLQALRVKYAGNCLRRTVGEELSSHTVFGYVATLGVFAGWLARGYTKANVLEGVPRPKKRKTMISALSQPEIERLVARSRSTTPSARGDPGPRLCSAEHAGVGGRVASSNPVLSNRTACQPSARIDGSGRPRVAILVY